MDVVLETGVEERQERQERALHTTPPPFLRLKTL